MPLKAVFPPGMKLAWTGAGLLCAAVLALLWLAAQRIKEAKVTARRGYCEEGTPAPEGLRAGLAGRPSLRLAILRGQRVPVEHFSLEWEDLLTVYDREGVPCAKFLRMEQGQIRRWQELQILCWEAMPAAAEFEIELKPGGTCFGSGWYYALRQGLQIEFSRQRAVTLRQLDLQAGEAGLDVESPEGKRAVALRAGGVDGAFGIQLELRREGARLRLRADGGSDQAR